MSADTVVTLPDLPVMYVAGDARTPIAEQAPKAFRELEATLPSLKGRKFYGAVLGTEYRACVGIGPNGDVRHLPRPAWTLPGGRYVRRKIPNWEEHLHLIGSTVEILCGRADFDPSRPCIEYYRSRKELFIMVPVR